MGYHDQRLCSLSRSTRPHISKLSTKHEVAGTFMDCSLRREFIDLPWVVHIFLFMGKKISSNTFSSGTLILSHVP